MMSRTLSAADKSAKVAEKNGIAGRDDADIRDRKDSCRGQSTSMVARWLPILGAAGCTVRARRDSQTGSIRILWSGPATCVVMIEAGTAIR